MKILIVDDDKDVADSLAMLLKLSGYQVTTCYAVLESLAEAKRVEPDVILHDIAMPGMSGYESVMLLRGDRLFRDTLIIAITAFDTVEARQRAKDAGFNCLLAKPANYQELLTLLPLP